MKKKRAEAKCCSLSIIFSSVLPKMFPVSQISLSLFFHFHSKSSSVPIQCVHHFASSDPLLLDKLTSLTSVGRVDRAQPTQGSPLS